MCRKLLELLGLLSPLPVTKSKFLVTVYVMSEGTAQGTPRPLQVLKRVFSYSIKQERYTVGAKIRCDSEVSRIIRYGYTHILADGTDVTYAPHTIYKVTLKEEEIEYVLA
jgi:hypothetical protein